MCQASRDAIERENHLEIFKNLTQVMGAVSSNIQHTTDEYASLLQDQMEFADKLRESQSQFKKDVSAVQEKALATVGSLNDNFHSFMETSVSKLINALAYGQGAEIVRIREEMQVFSQDMIVENSKLAKALTNELQHHHDRAIISLQINYQAQVESYEALSGYMNDITSTANRINDTVNSSLSMIDSIEYRLDSLSSKAEHIARGLAFFSSLPQLVTSVVRGLIVAAGAIFVLLLLYRFSKRLATCTAGACSAAYLLHFCGVYEFLARLPAQASEPHRSPSLIDHITTLNATQKGVGIVVVLWLTTYPVSRINTAINHAFARILSLYWVQQYSNDGGVGLLPSVEIPRTTMPRELNAPEKCIDTVHSRSSSREASRPNGS